MAPNKKKKKKAPPNPNRGFSTVSTAPKARKNESPEGPAMLREDEHAVTHQEGAPDLPRKSSLKEEESLSLEKMSPEELEAHLEDTELQSLVEKHGSLLKKNSLRISARLQTERRILRPQAHRLDTGKWLSEVEVDDILQISLAKTTGQKVPVPGHTSTPRLSILQDDLSLKLWELRLTLQKLGFRDSHVEAALGEVARWYSSVELPDTADVRIGSWCLEEALSWLALKSLPEELPSYETKDNHSGKKDDGLCSDTASLSGTPDRTPTASGMATPEESNGNAMEKSKLGDVPTAEVQDLDILSDSSDSDLEPEELLPKYLSARAQLYEDQPELFDTRTTDLKPANSTEGFQVSGIDLPKVRKLRSLLKKIESDPLFDKDTATWQWKAQMRTLAQGRVGGKRKSKAARVGDPSVDKLQQEQGKPQSSPETSEDTDDQSDQGDLFGTIFATREGEQIVAADVDGSKENTTMILRDFGKWTGSNPRRVLEDACKARDPGCRLSYKPIHSSHHSNRHSLEIKWSKPQEVNEPLALSTMTYSSTPHLASLAMTSIATPTSPQSEAYVSTVALFLIFASSPKEEKCYLRLPTAWRDVWSEMAAVKKDHQYTKDKAVLRDIRNMLQSSMFRIDSDGTTGSRTHNSRQPVKQADPALEKVQGPVSLISEILKTTWDHKIMSPLYQKILISRSSLPIWNFKREILQTLDAHQTLIICGETGCGKSTQVPNFILEQEMKAGRECRVWVTEPRRISAISLAQRVCEELGEREGDIGTRSSEVGYAIRLDSKVNERTRIVYATTGVLVRMLEDQDKLRNMTHLILDEVHERTIDSDFLLIVLRRLVTARPDLKVILMSATLDAEKFSKYLGGAPVCNVPGRTFPVEVKYLEDAIELTGYSTEGSNTAVKDDLDVTDSEDLGTDQDGKAKGAVRSNAGLNLSHGNYSRRTREALRKYDEYRINYDLIFEVLKNLAQNPQLQNYSKAILVFMPGMFEIRKLTDRILSHPNFVKGWVVHSLHSSVASEEQEKAFLIPPGGMRKIVVATNIAETGITIPDVTAVIDTGKEKVMRFDERRQLSRLVESFISRANAKQRRGRAGRVQRGICFHLFTKDRHDRLLSEQQIPEMLRLSLQDLVLRVKTCNLGGIEQTLSEALDAPSTKNIRRAIEALKDVKALTNSEELTPLGRQLARLPLDVFLGKLILNGVFFQCLDVSVTIAAILSSKSPFGSSLFPRSQVDLARLSFKKGDSDLITLYNAYSAWKRVRTSTNISEFQFCLKNCLSPKALANIEDLKVSLYVALVEGGLLKLDSKTQASLKRARWFTGRQRYFFPVPENLNVNAENDIIINSVISWSFYPKLLVREGKGWRNVANNQTITISPASVNKKASDHTKWLSFHSILQSSSHFTNANETSAVEEITVALLCGDAEFKMYSGIVAIDGNRIKFAVKDWKTMLALKHLGTQIREMLTRSFRSPERKLSEREQKYYDIWKRIFSQHLAIANESG